MKQKKKFLLIMCLFIIISGLFLWMGQAVQAKSEIMKKLIETQDKSGLPNPDDPVVVVAKVINGALGLVAILFFIMIVVAGFSWMTAGGNEETVTKAKQNISHAIIGLIIILFSYAITYFIFNILIGPQTS